ncbi:MAG: pantoate--beta-alanine ligase [Kiritimatiellia bacterium]|jgi:pantoate--beta-alanine ligase
MQTITQPAQMTAWSMGKRANGRRIGFVPTMGYLHEGHLSLMRLLRPHVDELIVSIYVNPLQFAPGEDFASYPRDLPGDEAKCKAEGVDLIFMPTDLYPPSFATRVSVSDLDRALCSVSRPTFFTGVATVVARLFGVTRCHVAAFGEKDYQQLTIIRRVVSDLALPVEIVPGPIVRENDGLAMSSRNVYLSDADRTRALTLNRALTSMQSDANEGVRDVSQLVARAKDRVDCDRIDYIQVVDTSDLTVLTEVDRPARVAIAAMYDNTRLIDNMALLPGR